MTKLQQGAWINAHTGHWSFIDEHSNWAKREGNLQRIGLPVSVWEAIRDIPNDYCGQNRESILRTVMAAGGVRMRGHGDVVVFEFTVDSAIAVPACRGVLSQIAGPMTLCRFNNLATSQTVEVFYGDYFAQDADADAFHWQRP